VLRFTSRGAGMTPDAFSVINYESVFHGLVIIMVLITAGDFIGK